MPFRCRHLPPLPAIIFTLPPPLRHYFFAPCRYATLRARFLRHLRVRSEPCGRGCRSFTPPLLL